MPDHPYPIEPPWFATAISESARRELAAALRDAMTQLDDLRLVTDAPLTTVRALGLALADSCESDEPETRLTEQYRAASGVLARRVAVIAYHTDDPDLRLGAQALHAVLGEYARDGLLLFSEFCAGEEPDSARYGSLRSLTAIPERIPEHCFNPAVAAFRQANRLAVDGLGAYLRDQYAARGGLDIAESLRAVHNIFVGVAHDTGGLNRFRAPESDADIAADRADRARVADEMDAQRETLARLLDQWPEGVPAPGRAREIAAGIAASLRGDGGHLVDVGADDVPALIALEPIIRDHERLAGFGLESLSGRGLSERVAFAAEALVGGYPEPGVLRAAAVDSINRAMEGVLLDYPLHAGDAAAQFFAAVQVLISDTLAGLAEHAGSDDERAAYLFPARAAEHRGMSVIYAQLKREIEQTEGDAPLEDSQRPGAGGT